jgi:hypothetical protein
MYLTLIKEIDEQNRLGDLSNFNILIELSDENKIAR